MRAPIEVHDTSLRDAIGDFVTLHVTSAELAEVLPLLDAAGFASIDAFGGSTFFPTMTVLGEDPWARLRSLRAAVHHTPLQAVLRGRLGFGMRPVPEGTLRAVLRTLRSYGVDRLKIADPGLDPRGAAQLVEQAVEQGFHVTASVVLSWGDTPDAGERVTTAADAYFFAGAHAVGLQDPFGLLTPVQLGDVVRTYGRHHAQPLRLHLHDMNLLGVAALERGLMAGAGAVDTTLAALAWSYSPPHAEAVAVALRGSPDEPSLDLGKIEETSAWFEDLKTRKGFRYRAVYGVDHQALRGEMPTAVKRALLDELRESGRKDLFEASWAQVPAAWEALGRPPLLKPFVQAVCGQAVENAAGPPFARLDPRALAYLRGEYGPAKPGARADLVDRARRDPTPAEPPLPEVGALDPTAYPSEEDRLTAALFPEAGATFLRGRDQGRSISLPDLYAEASGALPSPTLVPRRLRVGRQGESFEVNLEGLGPADGQSRILFLRVGSETAPVRVDFPRPGAPPVYGIHYHGRRHQVEIVDVLEPGRKSLPVLLREDGHLHEVLYSFPRGKGS